MKVYTISKLGKEMVRNRSGDADTLSVLDFLFERHTATSDELEIAGEGWLIRTLARRGLIREETH